MSTTEGRVSHAEALAIADQILPLLQPFCERLVIAGSIRRGRQDVGDIELVAIPRTAPIADFFGDPVGSRDLLHQEVVRLTQTGVFTKRLDVNGRPRFGVKTKFLAWQEFPIDLFTAEPDNWGLILMIRTGPGDWNKRLLTPWYQGGVVLPPAMRSQGGWLWRGNTRLATPTENAVFDELGIAPVPPEERR